MKDVFVFSIMLALAAPACAVEVMADQIKNSHLYIGNARAVFSHGEKFEISSESTSSVNDGSMVFSGNVAVRFNGKILHSDYVSLKKQSDGASILEAEKFTLADKIKTK